MSKPKILLLDIETAPMLGQVWSLWHNDVALNQLQKDWHILSWAAKWLDNPKVMYSDQSRAKDLSNDKTLLEDLVTLLRQADILITHNGKAFDEKKINARFLYHGMPPVGSYKHVDTLEIVKRKFALTSNKLEYIAKYLNVKHKKSGHKKFPGHELWSECLKGNKAAWKEMKEYNIRDVLVLEEVYKKLAAWDNSVNPNWYSEGTETICKCGSTHFVKDGFHYTTSGKYQILQCKECGHKTHDRKNLFSKEKIKSLRSR